MVAVQETVRRLVNAGIPVFAVPGNHDAAFLARSLYAEALAGATVFDQPRFGPPVSVELAGGPLHVYGVAHDEAEEPDPLSTFRKSEASGIHLVVLHGSVPDAPHWGRGEALRLPVDELAALEVDYIALGDYHRFRPPGKFGPPPLSACYSGSFAAVSVTETGPRGVVIARLAPGGPPEVQLVPSGLPTIVGPEEVDVTPFGDEQAVADAVSKRLPAGSLPIVRLTGEPSFPLEADRVLTRLEGKFDWISLQDETRYYGSRQLRELAERPTVVGHIVRLGLERIEAAPDAEQRSIADRGLRVALRAIGVE